MLSTYEAKDMVSKGNASADLAAKQAKSQEIANCSSKRKWGKCGNYWRHCSTTGSNWGEKHRNKTSRLKRRVKWLPERCFYYGLLVWLMKVATRAKGGCRRRSYVHGTLQDLHLWQKSFAEAVSIVNTIMLIVCAAVLAVGWGMAVPLMCCPYCPIALLPIPWGWFGGVDTFLSWWVWGW